MSSREPIVILGAGLAGLSFACALLEHGVPDRIVILERRDGVPSAGSWCTWATEPLRFAELARRSWDRWSIVSDGTRATARSPEHPLLLLEAPTVLDAARERLLAAAQVELRTGVEVLGLSERADAVSIHTSAGTVVADHVFDARGQAPTGACEPAERSGGIELRQSFLGWTVAFDDPTLSAQEATLMAFDGADAEGLAFHNVLPLDARTALIRHARLAATAPGPAHHRARLTALLTDLASGGGWRVLAEERGELAMTTRAFPAHRGPRIHTLGAAAGAVRPSSGYAFSRIQRHSTEMARALVAGARSGAARWPERVGPAHLAGLDAIFLHALAAEPQRFPEIFLEMARRVPGTGFARFMTDMSSPLEEARMIAALPKEPFLAAALRAGVPGRELVTNRMPGPRPRRQRQARPRSLHLAGGAQ